MQEVFWIFFIPIKVPIKFFFYLKKCQGKLFNIVKLSKLITVSVIALHKKRIINQSKNSTIRIKPYWKPLSINENNFMNFSNQNNKKFDSKHRLDFFNLDNETFCISVKKLTSRFYRWIFFNYF